MKLPSFYYTILEIKVIPTKPSDYKIIYSEKVPKKVIFSIIKGIVQELEQELATEDKTDSELEKEDETVE